MNIATDQEVLALHQREHLLATTIEGAHMYIGAISVINQSRSPENQIPLLRHEDYRERAEDWLTRERIAAAAVLPAVNNHQPVLVVPRLNRPITVQENVEAWLEAGGNPGNQTDPAARAKLLEEHWTADELSGFDPEIGDETPFEILPTAYDFEETGLVEAQKAALETLRSAHPALHIASIFNGVILAKRSGDWQSTTIRSIDLQPALVGGNYEIPYAQISNPDDGPNSGSVGTINIHPSTIPARRVVR